MSSNAQVVSSFNALNFKKILNIKDMEENKNYSIDGSYRTTTEYGNVVVLQLGDRNLYLPKRFNTLNLTDDEDKSLCKLEIIYP